MKMFVCVQKLQVLFFLIHPVYRDCGLLTVTPGVYISVHFKKIFCEALKDRKCIKTMEIPLRFQGILNYRFQGLLHVQLEMVPALKAMLFLTEKRAVLFFHFHFMTRLQFTGEASSFI